MRILSDYVRPATIGVELAKVGGTSPPTAHEWGGAAPPPTLLEVDLASQNKRLDPPSELKVAASYSQLNIN